MCFTGILYQITLNNDDEPIEGKRREMLVLDKLVLGT